MLKQRRLWLCLSGLVFACGSVGCASTRVETPRVADVSKSLADRTGHVLRDEEAGLVPPAVSFDDGLTEDEAVGIALWNHPGFHTDLASLGFSRADVVEAGLLRNPILSLLFPLGPKQLESTFSWPIEAIWQRPHRVAAAELDAARVGESLVEHGLDLVRDTRLAHSDALLARDRLALAEDQFTVRKQILEITEARSKPAASCRRRDPAAGTRRPLSLSAA